MEFKGAQAIYIQIAAFIEEKILREEWKADERIPSARDLAVAMEVNPNTVVKTFELLQQKGVVYNKRGLGYFVADSAKELVLKEYRTTFIKHDMPGFFHTATLLGFTPEEVVELYQSTIKQETI